MPHHATVKESGVKEREVVNKAVPPSGEGRQSAFRSSPQMNLRPEC